jgi:hypothetical protein
VANSTYIASAPAATEKPVPPGTTITNLADNPAITNEATELERRLDPDPLATRASLIYNAPAAPLT